MRKFKQFVKEHKFGILLVFIVLVIAVIFCESKRSFHVDESLSFALANHPEGWVSYEPFGWFDKSFFANYGVTDSPFNYARVYHNQTWDVHPPLYYYLLHTICSFFPYRFSIWFGLIINIVCFLVCSVLVYAITKRLINKDGLASFAVLMFGLNKLVLECVVFIRMYMMSMMFVLFFVYFAIKIITNDKHMYINYIGLLVSTICGGLTHYHFYFIIGVFSLIISIYLLYIRRYKELLVSFIAVVAATLLNLFVFFPETFRHFASSHASNAVNSLGINLGKILATIDIADASAYIIASIIIIVGLIIKNNKNQKDRNVICAIMLMSFVFSFALIAQTSSILSQRYIVQTISLFAIGISAGTHLVFENIRYNLILEGVLLTIFLLSSVDISQVVEDYNTTKSWEFAKDNQYGVAVVLTENDTADYEINELFTDLRWYYATGITQLDKEFNNEIKDNLVLYVEKSLNIDEVKAYLKKEINQQIGLKLQNINKNLFYVYSIDVKKSETNISK